MTRKLNAKTIASSIAKLSKDKQHNKFYRPRFVSSDEPEGTAKIYATNSYVAIVIDGMTEHDAADVQGYLSDRSFQPSRTWICVDMPEPCKVDDLFKAEPTCDRQRIDPQFLTDVLSLCKALGIRPTVNPMKGGPQHTFPQYLIGGYGNGGIHLTAIIAGIRD